MSVPEMVRRGLGRTERARRQASSVQAGSLAARARKMARVAELYEREARWWRVLVEHSYSPAACGLPLVYGRAAIAAEASARARVRTYRELEADYWRRSLAVASDTGLSGVAA
ncbi:hypothetical protein B0I33_105144 [Prauserella shujinwangii]|uniref:Uncharacterized protein n=1 Tax=Prauserella shujinwangii TaxID=1453103 RepID=A0A2T0LUQ5_9PSEU|nr:hypothetical protein B0I33_105144 [Prauserella shujinwangii]